PPTPLRLSSTTPATTSLSTLSLHDALPIFTRAHLGRGPCQARNQCARGCSFSGYFSSLSATLPAARQTGRLTIVTDAIVHSVIYDERRDRAAGVPVIEANTKARSR